MIDCSRVYAEWTSVIAKRRIECRSMLMSSYAALGLLPSIPLPTGASSSKTHRAPINLPSTSASTSNEGEETPKVSYGRIIRDDEGNVIDIILDDEEEDNGSKEVVEEGREALNPEKEWVPERVEAKTDVVRCEFLFFSSPCPPSYPSSIYLPHQRIVS